MRTIPTWTCAFLLLFCSTPAFAQKAKLLRHTVVADGHPLAVWEKSADKAREAIILIHGRTWSALPDFDLQVEGEDLSLMDGLVEAGYAVFAVDLRGYGSTPRDDTQWLTPNRSADDVAIVGQWIQGKSQWDHKPHLFGWSMGSTIAQLAVQRHPGQFASLTLFGYWFDEDQKISVDSNPPSLARAVNTAEAAASDFTIPGSISKRAIEAYVSAALRTDPIRVDARANEQYNVLAASKLSLPVLLIAGAKDPIAPAEIQSKFYARLTGKLVQYQIIAGADHAAFLETTRAEFLRKMTDFLKTVAALPR